MILSHSSHIATLWIRSSWRFGEADFLVNLYEDNESADAVRAARKNIFRTQSGLKMLEDMFNVDN